MSETAARPHKPGDTIKAKETQLGDIVRLHFPDEHENPYSDCTVRQHKDDGYVKLFRPYVQTADFSYTGGVICYIGIEEFEVAPEAVLMLRRIGPALK